MAYSDLNPLIYQELIRVARRAGIIYFSDIAPLVELDIQSSSGRDNVNRMLSDISRYEVSQSRHMLSAVVVLKDEGLPDSGFFDLAAELDLFSGSSKEDRLKFFSEELRRAHNHWASA